MSIIKWADELSVKINLIDTQHKKLFELLDNFYTDIRNGSSGGNMLGVIKSLKDYTAFHFSAEEKLMKQHQFPGYGSHKKEHDTFIARVHEFEERFKNGKLLLTLEVTNFIKDWILKHIKETDHQYSGYLIQRGVK